MFQFIFHSVNLITAKVIDQRQEEIMEGGMN